MIQSFDIQRISLGGPVFDIEKLYWLNGEYLRTLSVDDLKIKSWHGQAMTLNSPPSLVPFSHALIYYPMQSTGQVFIFKIYPPSLPKILPTKA